MKKHKLKVCVIGCRFNHPFGNRVLAMWRLLAKRYNVEVHIITTDRWIDKPGDSRLKDSKNLKIHKLLTLGAKYGQFKHSMPNLGFTLIGINPDIIYAQEEPIQMGVTWPAYWTARYLGKPFVFFTWENLYQKWFFPIGAIEDQIINGSDLLIAGTPVSKEILQRKGADVEKIAVLPETGIDPQMFKPLKNRKIGKTILYAGRLVPEKGLNTLLRARVILRKRHKDYNYVFIGEGPMKDYLTKLAKKYGDIKLLKPVPYEKVPKIYHKGDVFFYASLRTKKWEEQYGYSMLEALSSGLPVISTKGISGPEAIVKDGSTGFLIPEDDERFLADKLQSILDKKIGLVKMQRNARLDALTRLSNSAVADAMYRLLIKVKFGDGRNKNITKTG